MKIAVVGVGISGLSTALSLSSRHEVHLFESESRLGGHAHTVAVDSGREKPVSVDTGFLVYNTKTYPHFTKFLDFLGVYSVESDMTLSIKTRDGLEWAGDSLNTVFAQRRNLLNPSFLGMLTDILRFNREAAVNLQKSRANRWTLEDLLKSQNYGRDFQRLYLLPMTGAIWSMSYIDVLKFPAETFLNFCVNHRLLQITDRPIWRTIRGGAINYVEKVHKRLNFVHSKAPVQSLRKKNAGLVIHTNGQEVEFDKVVLATHAPTSRSIVQDHFPDLAQELVHLKVTPNHVDLHEDSSLMPQNKKCWSAWNVQAQDTVRDKSDICLTYYLNKLQPLDSNKQHFVTLNSKQNLKNVVARFRYDHPQFDFQAIDAQKRIDDLQGRHNIYFAGAWTRYGFHEDGILSGANVSEKIGVQPVWM